MYKCILCLVNEVLFDEVENVLVVRECDASTLVGGDEVLVIETEELVVAVFDDLCVEGSVGEVGFLSLGEGSTSLDTSLPDSLNSVSILEDT
jgi:hypothetical protein